MTIKYELDPGAYAPGYAHGSDAGIDLRTPIPFKIHPGFSKTIDTGVHILIPDGFCGLMVSKSGLNINKSIQSTGLVDAGYTGSMRVKLYNSSNTTWSFEAGDKISQLVILPVPEVSLELGEVSHIATERGNGGFGSTGR